MDAIEERLAGAGRTAADDEIVRAALAELAAAHTPKRRLRRPVVVGLGVAIVGVLALGGAGVAVAATNHWGPWDYVPNADLVISTETVEPNGVVDHCESHIHYEDADAATSAFIQSWISRHDIDAIEPDPAWVESEQQAVAPGGGWRDTPDRAYFSEARIQQDAKTQAVWTQLTDAVFAAGLDKGHQLTAPTQTQCTTDPITAP